MPNYISGTKGKVVLSGSGLYSTEIYRWSIDNSATLYDKSSFKAENDTTPMVERCTGLKSWSGSYSARQCTSLTANISGSGYDSFVYKMDINVTTNIVDGTKFKDEYANKSVTALSDITGTIECYIDDTTNIPLAGTEVNIVAIVGDAGNKTLSFTAITDKVGTEVARDGSGRRVSLSFQNSTNSITAANSFPLAGATGSGQFYTDQTKYLSGNIVINSVKFTMAADRVSGNWDFGFDGTGALTPN